MFLSISYLRSFRVLGFAIFDFAASFIMMYLIAKYVGHTESLLYATLPLSVLAHALVKQNTPLTQMAFGDGFYGVKLLLIALSIAAYNTW